MDGHQNLKPKYVPPLGKFGLILIQDVWLKSDVLYPKGTLAVKSAKRKFHGFTLIILSALVTLTAATLRECSFPQNFSKGFAKNAMGIKQN